MVKDDEIPAITYGRPKLVKTAALRRMIADKSDAA
jgi:hypothetical protein